MNCINCWKSPPSLVRAAIWSIFCRLSSCMQPTFLGFGRCFIGLLEEDHFQVRYGVEKGEPRRLDITFPEGVATQALRTKEVFWTDEASRTPGANLDVIAKYQVHQFLGVPLLGSSGQVLGMFARARSLGPHGHFARGHSPRTSPVESGCGRARSREKPSSFRAAPAPCRSSHRTCARD